MLFVGGMMLLANTSWALDKKDGVYQITNGADLVDFSYVVSLDGEYDAKAVLTADIDMAGQTEFIPIGQVGAAYKGTFDGQEHRVKNLIIEQAESEYQGLFGVVTGGAVIRNIIIDQSCYIVAKGYAAGLIGGSNGTGTVLIENCGNEADVQVTEANAGGIFGVDMNSAAKLIVHNCYNTGSITGGRESAAISGWLGDNPEIIACYNIGTVVGVDGEGRDLFRSNGIGSGKVELCFSAGTTQTNVKDIDLDIVATGALAYMLNNNSTASCTWFQNLDNGQTVDKFPVPFKSHGTVYAVGTLNCDGTAGDNVTGYSNTDASIPTPHTFVDGVCSVCGNVDMTYTEVGADGYYLLGTPQQLNWFAALVNKGANESKARLTADIDFTAYTQKDVMIGDGIRFKGVFDGQEHTVNVSYYREKDNVGLFCHIEGAAIRNLVVKGDIETSAKFAGGLFVETWGATVIENVLADVDITATIADDGTHGGLGAIGHDNLIVRNCAVLGDILGDNCFGNGGFVGYTHGGNGTQFINCYVAGEIWVDTSKSNDIICRNNPSVRNCYFLDSFGLYENPGSQQIEEEAMENGELAYKLNGKVSGGENWYQTLDEDKYPVPFKSHKKVYATGHIKCNGQPSDDMVYSNEKGEATRDAHDYDDNGICRVCDSRLVKTAAQLMMAADDINLGVADPTIEIKLDADLDMSSEIDYQGIGTRDYPFKGVFDGQGHIVSGMNISIEESDNHGLIGVVSGNAEVKNVTVDATCSVFLYKAGYAAGIVGASIGTGTLLIENCGNEAEVYTESANSAGIFGVNDLSQMVVTIRNCYNTGEITGMRESAGICSWMGSNGTIENCYNSGYVTGLDGERTFHRDNNNSTTIINCYENMGSQVQTFNDDQLQDGELCYKLNGSESGVARFFQTIGSDKHPVLHGSAGLIYFDGTKYTNDGSGIESVSEQLIEKGSKLYTINGTRINEMQRGINIVRMANGKVKKYIVK